MAVGIAVIALSARISATIPGSAVPQSAQTLAVLLVGAILGARDGAIAVLAYLLAGGLGLPVFAEGGSGWEHVTGPTAGYLVGFVLAAWTVGRMADRGNLTRAVSAFVGMMVGHAEILALGWLWLTRGLGMAEAFHQGVAPFLLGGLFKSAIAAGVAAAWWRSRS